MTFPQDVNEPSQIFPRLPEQINIIKVRKLGLNDTSKEFRVRRHNVQKALAWLKKHNPAYQDIIISDDRLNRLPEDGNLSGIQSVEYNDNIANSSTNDKGPAPQQNDCGDSTGETHSGVVLPDEPSDIRQEVQDVVDDVVGGERRHNVTINLRGTVTIPWPTRDNIPLSEFTTQHFFTLAFPSLFPYGTGDFHINRERTCLSFSDWAEHLLWYKDGRFAHHPYFKFVVHNMLMRKRALKKSTFIVKQQLGDGHMTVSDLRDQLQAGNKSIAQKIVYFGATLRGTAQYWAERGKEMRALTQFQINKGAGLPTFFTTGSCAEYHFKPLKRLIGLYLFAITGEMPDLEDRTKLFQALPTKHPHCSSLF